MEILLLLKVEILMIGKFSRRGNEKLFHHFFSASLVHKKGIAIS
jgi:hypothetical protein